MARVVYSDCWEGVLVWWGEGRGGAYSPAAEEHALVPGGGGGGGGGGEGGGDGG